jgi:hypothetical protein
MNTQAIFLCRKDALAYLRSKFGIGSKSEISRRDGPPYWTAGSRRTLYRPEDLDEWALALIRPREAAE